MIGRMQLRQLLENNHRGNLVTFENQIWHMAGLTDEHGVPYQSETGDPILRNPIINGREENRLRLGQISLRGLAEAIMGEDAVELMNPNRTGAALRRRQLMEAGTAAVHPSAFSNINTFSGVATGLLEAEMLAAYTNPIYIGDKLAKPSQTRQFSGRKTIGVTRIGDKAEPRQPGMPTKRATVGERWIVQPETTENSLSMEILQETVYLDITGDLVRQANDIGDWIRYNKEMRILDVFAGVVNNYNYKGNTYNTYISNGYYNNVLTGNELLTPENLNKAEIVIADMRDPDTGTRINIMPNMLVCQHEFFAGATAILNGQDLAYRDKPADGAGVIQRYVNGPSIYTQRGYELVKSRLLYERINAANGLNQSASNAGKYWWLLDSNGFMTYEENWPLRVQNAVPGQMDMIDRGVLMYIKADERGVPMVREPRKAVRCSG